jgi:2-polyprenyl-6-methoxyphenol hydroxylase-like FAD-dependent oxidoreductase
MPDGGSAVVVGAGIGGLVTARVLADRFARVTVLERDTLPHRAEPRAGVPQDRHGHVLLAAGQRALEELFPGLAEELFAAGAVPLDLRFYQSDVAWPRLPRGPGLVSLSRPLLEWSLRRRVAAIPGITLRERMTVTGLAGDRTTVTGVICDTGERLAADLVVDCTGRGSRAGRWLAAVGCPAPPVSDVVVKVGYASKVLHRADGPGDDGAGVFVLPTAPHQKRAGLLLPIEGDRWLLSMGGWHGDVPGDDRSFRAHADSLPRTAIADVVAEAVPLSDVAVYRLRSSRWRHFERLRRPPGGFLVLGDAICSLNPVYGQGMTCAALQAIELGRLLDRHRITSTALASAFYRRAAKVLTVPWCVAVGADFRYPETTGPRSARITLLTYYWHRLQLAARVDPQVRRVFLAVQHLTAPFTALLAPGIMVRVLRAGRPEPSHRRSPAR